jgi:glycosyltransferase involved in cell wall biosynthesis
MKVLVIIPSYNEEKNLPILLDKLSHYNYDFLVINDCSTDDTVNVLKNSNVHFLDLPINLGIGGTVQTGYKYAYLHGYDAAVQVDGDGQHNPEYIQALIQGINEGADMVIGSRFLEYKGFQSSASRRAGKSFLGFLIKLLSGVKVTDPTSGFRACNRKVLRIFAKSYPSDYPEPETIIQVAKRKYIIKEVPVIMNERSAGISSIGIFKSFYYMVKVSLSIIISSFMIIEKKF